MKNFKTTALILSLLIALCGCSKGENSLRESTATKEETAIVTTAPVTTAKPAETAAETTSAPPQTTTSAAAAQTEQTTAAHQQTTAAATQPPQTTAATTQPPQTAAAATQPPQTAAATAQPPETTAEAATEAPAENQPLSGSILYDYSQKWFYNQLNGKQKPAYERLYNAVSQGQEKVSVSDLGMNLDDLSAVIFSYEKDNPCFLDTYWEYSVEYLGTEDNSDVQSIIPIYDASVSNDLLKTKADRVLAEAKKLPNDYQRLKYVHDWISENTVYKDSGQKYTKRADGPIIQGTAICSGYSKALMYFAQELGIPCLCIEGRTNEEHLWNMVKLNGNWYHVDMTYDDPNTPSGANALRYDYFLVSDSTISQDHTITDGMILPSAPNDYN